MHSIEPGNFGSAIRPFHSIDKTFQILLYANSTGSAGGTFGVFFYQDVKGLVPYDHLRRFGTFSRPQYEC